MVIIFYLIFIQTYEQLDKYIFVLNNHIQMLPAIKKTCKKETNISSPTDIQERSKKRKERQPVEELT